MIIWGAVSQILLPYIGAQSALQNEDEYLNTFRIYSPPPVMGLPVQANPSPCLNCQELLLWVQGKGITEEQAEHGKEVMEWEVVHT